MIDHAQSPTPTLLPTVAEILAIDLIAAGKPSVLTEDVGLDNRVRWIHIADASSIAGLLDGGELILTTAAGWPSDQSALSGYIDDLVDAAIAGLVVELGWRYDEVPEWIVDRCRAAGIAVIALGAVVKFVRVTEEVHRRIIADQTDALAARDRIHALFTALSLRGSPAGYIVHELGDVLGSTVVLEDVAHDVIAVGAPVGSDEAALADWHRISARAREIPAGDDTSWIVTPVEARGTRWGYLVAYPGAPLLAGRRNALEQAAVSLALSRLADGDHNQWVRVSQQDLVDSLIEGRFRGEDSIITRLEASGLPVRGRELAGLVAVGTATAASPRIAAALRLAARAIGAVALAAVGVTPDREDIALAIISLPGGTPPTDLWTRRLARALASDLGEADAAGIRLVIGTQATTIPSLLDSLARASASTRLGASHKVGGISVLRTMDRPFELLLLSLRSDPRVQEYVQDSLRPLVDYDRDHDGDLLTVLWAYVNHPGNRSLAASASLLSRSVFYQRIALIEDLLGVELAAGATVSALYSALFSLRSGLRA